MTEPIKTGYWACPECSFTEWPDPLTEDTLAICPNCGSDDISFIEAIHINEGGKEFVVYLVGDGDVQINVKLKCRICQNSVWADLPAGDTLLECGNCSDRRTWHIGVGTGLHRQNSM